MSLSKRSYLAPKSTCYLNQITKAWKSQVLADSLAILTQKTKKAIFPFFMRVKFPNSKKSSPQLIILMHHLQYPHKDDILEWEDWNIAVQMLANIGILVLIIIDFCWIFKGNKKMNW